MKLRRLREGTISEEKKSSADKKKQRAEDIGFGMYCNIKIRSLLITPTAGSNQSLHYSKKSKRTENLCTHTYPRELGQPKEGQRKSSLCSFNVSTEMKDGLFAHPHRTQPRPQQAVTLLPLPRGGCNLVSWEFTHTERGEQEIYISKFRAFDYFAHLPPTF